MARAIWTVRMLATLVVGVAVVTPMPGIAIMARMPDMVGPPDFLAAPPCRVSMAQPGGTGPGTAIPFRALMLGAPVVRTTTSFTTGGGGTSNNMIAAQRKAAGLPYKPPTVNPDSAALPATFAVDRSATMAPAPYQQLPLTPSKRIAAPYGLVFAQAVSPTRGRIASLALYLADRPKALPRYRLTSSGPLERGCQQRTMDIFAPAMSTAAVARMFARTDCNWLNLTGCKTRADWPHGQVLFVTSMYGTMSEYRWIDYDLLADRQFAKARR